jgi:hypothetical protein
LNVLKLPKALVDLTEFLTLLPVRIDLPDLLRVLCYQVFADVNVLVQNDECVLLINRVILITSRIHRLLSSFAALGNLLLLFDLKHLIIGIVVIDFVGAHLYILWVEQLSSYLR